MTPHSPGGLTLAASTHSVRTAIRMYGRSLALPLESLVPSPQRVLEQRTLADGTERVQVALEGKSTPLG